MPFILRIAGIKNMALGYIQTGSFKVVDVPTPLVEKKAVRELCKGHLKAVAGKTWKLGLDEVLAHAEHALPQMVRFQYDKINGTLWASTDTAHHFTECYATREKKLAAYDRMSISSVKSGLHVHDATLNFYLCYPLIDKTTPEPRNFSFTLEVAPILLDTTSQGCILEFAGTFINIKNEQLLFSECVLRVTPTTYYTAKNKKLNRVKQERHTTKIVLREY